MIAYRNAELVVYCDSCWHWATFAGGEWFDAGEGRHACAEHVPPTDVFTRPQCVDECCPSPVHCAEQCEHTPEAA